MLLHSDEMQETIAGVTQFNFLETHLASLEKTTRCKLYKTSCSVPSGTATCNGRKTSQQSLQKLEQSPTSSNYCQPNKTNIFLSLLEQVQIAVLGILCHVNSLSVHGQFDDYLETYLLYIG